MKPNINKTTGDIGIKSSLFVLHLSNISSASFGDTEVSVCSNEGY